MSFWDYFSSKNTSSASVAKERLQIIVAHERGHRGQPKYLPKMKKELLDVIRKYVEIDDDMVEVQFDQDGSRSMLELNVTMPEEETALN